jgi:acetyltransferase-like isoleucine patch superfamily enzyme
MMSTIGLRIRQGKSPFWRGLKRVARGVLQMHVPVGSVTRPLFQSLYGLHVMTREGLLWALRFFWFEPLFRSQCVAVGANFRMEQLPYLLGKGRIVIGDRVRLSGKPSIGFSNRLHPDPELIIGDGTFIGHDCSLVIATAITIGKHCLLAGGVKIYDVDAHPIDAARRRVEEPFPPENSRPVIIEDDVWVGTRAMILKGVAIGARSIVGAGAVVTSDVPPDVVVAGNPARVVKRLTVSDPTPVKSCCARTEGGEEQRAGR